MYVVPSDISKARCCGGDEMEKKQKNKKGWRCIPEMSEIKREGGGGGQKTKPAATVSGGGQRGGSM